jgi:hypothetical protein
MKTSCAEVRIWPNAAKAVRDGEVKLLMVG